MKRINNLFEKIISLDNIYKAEERARRNKSKRPEVKKFLQNKDQLLLQLQQKLINEEYRTSKYHTFIIKEPKERLIFKLPYYPDRIVHHAIMNVLEPIWVSIFTKDTYSCIKNRGIHAAVKNIKRDLKSDVSGTKYCLKLDIKKFYPSINHQILKTIIRRKIKDIRLLRLLDHIIDSASGVPIGNYLSQFFANLYLAYFDHWIKETKRIKYYYRYADDIVILSDNKDELHTLLQSIIIQLNTIKLQIKRNYQIFAVDTRGLSFVGYVFYHTHTRIRKNIKLSMCRKEAKLRHSDFNKYRNHMCSYLGWLKYCNSTNLINKVITQKALLVYAYKQNEVNT